jgi:hypothetical protein
MSFQPRIGQSSRCFSGACRHKPVARLTLTAQTAGQGGSDPVQVDLARLATSGRNHLFWATVQGGRILRLEEQYLR